jgi:hypothetical protein
MLDIQMKGAIIPYIDLAQRNPPRRLDRLPAAFDLGFHGKHGTHWDAPFRLILPLRATILKIVARHKNNRHGRPVKPN